MTPIAFEGDSETIHFKLCVEISNDCNDTDNDDILSLSLFNLTLCNEARKAL